MIDKTYILNDILSVLSNHINDKEDLVVFMSNGLYEFIAPSNISIKNYDKIFGIELNIFTDNNLIWYLGTETHRYE